MKYFGQDREAFDRRIRELGADIRFVGGRAALPHPGKDVAVLIDGGRQGPDGPAQLLTVAAGFPPPAEVVGLLCTVRRADTGDVVMRATTDRRGQVWLRGLEAVEYRATVAPRPAFTVETDTEEGAVMASYLFGGGRRGGERRAVLELASPDAQYAAMLCETPSEPRHLALWVEVPGELAPDGLVRFEAHGPDAEPVVRGFIGLGPEFGGRRSGEVWADLLVGGRAEHVEGPGGLRLTLAVGEGPTGEDIDLLMRSLRATSDPEGRRTLEGSLARLAAK